MTILPWLWSTVKHDMDKNRSLDLARNYGVEETDLKLVQLVPKLQSMCPPDMKEYIPDFHVAGNRGTSKKLIEEVYASTSLQKFAVDKLASLMPNNLWWDCSTTEDWWQRVMEEVHKKLWMRFPTSLSRPFASLPDLVEECTAIVTERTVRAMRKGRGERLESVPTFWRAKPA